MVKNLRNSKKKKITFDDIQKHFGKTSKKASQLLGISITQLKRKCREFDIPRWPGRRIKSLFSKIDKLNHKMKNSAGSEARDILMRIQILKKRVQSIRNDPSLVVESTAYNDDYDFLPMSTQCQTMVLSKKRSGKSNSGNNNNTFTKKSQFVISRGGKRKIPVIPKKSKQQSLFTQRLFTKLPLRKSTRKSKSSKGRKGDQNSKMSQNNNRPLPGFKFGNGVRPFPFFGLGPNEVPPPPPEDPKTPFSTQKHQKDDLLVPSLPKFTTGYMNKKTVSEPHVRVGGDSYYDRMPVTTLFNVSFDGIKDEPTNNDNNDLSLDMDDDDDDEDMNIEYGLDDSFENMSSKFLTKVPKKKNYVTHGHGHGVKDEKELNESFELLESKYENGMNMEYDDEYDIMNMKNPSWDIKMPKLNLPHVQVYNEFNIAEEFSPIKKRKKKVIYKNNYNGSVKMERTNVGNGMKKEKMSTKRKCFNSRNNNTFEFKMIPPKRMDLNLSIDEDDLYENDRYAFMAPFSPTRDVRHAKGNTPYSPIKKKKNNVQRLDLSFEDEENEW